MSPIKSTTRGRAIATLSRSSPVVVVVVVVVVVDRCDDTDTDTDTLVRDRDRCHPPTTDDDRRRPTTDRSVAPQSISTPYLSPHRSSWTFAPSPIAARVRHRRRQGPPARHPSYIIIIIARARWRRRATARTTPTTRMGSIDAIDRTPSPPRIHSTRASRRSIVVRVRTLGATAARAFLRATLARARSGIKPAVFNARTADMVVVEWRSRDDEARGRVRACLACMGKQYDA